ncbi:DNA-binding transcriptional regulator, AcrR family [Terribacillus halophilus]|uniref:DNA-binding transcriptional regulator, AcrR family n=1 Tax=Terribacillus halophilus TaxID=361279 RepID=A0A1G6PP60_9BACI|nr:TetR family transcriptional regulator [Terribacillus halophilus]SDC81296.1 DNA-binding transcriptional regulator, AcrR family [Terribacillus halophilus]
MTVSHILEVLALDKKEKITKAAIEVFMEKGINKATISDIVKKAGIAQGTFYLYFPSKLDVMPSIAQVMLNVILDSLNERANSSEIDILIKEMVEVVFDVTNEYRELSKLIYSGLTQTQHIENWEDIYEPLYDWIENKLMQGQKNGYVRQFNNTRSVAKILIGTIESSAEQLFMYNDSDSNLKVHKEELIDFLCIAIKNNPTH